MTPLLTGYQVGPTLLLLGITWIPQYGAKDAHFIVPFIVGALTIIATGLYEAFLAPNPLLHPVLFKRVRSFTVMLVIAATGGMLFYGIQVFLPTYLQAIYDGTDGRRIGIDGMPFGAGSQVGGVGSAVLLPLMGPLIGTNWMLAIGVGLQLLFIPLMCIPGVNDKGMALAFSFLASMGMSTVS